MKDRIPKDPGRVLITPENGSTPFYATMTRADNPEQEGTPLNKNSLLKDTTAALFGLGTDALPDDVLRKIASDIPNLYVWKKTGASYDGYVCSFDKNAYPPAVSDGFIYTALGMLGEKNIKKIAEFTTATATNKQYLELPDDLRNYSFVFIKATNLVQSTQYGDIAFFIYIEASASETTTSSRLIAYGTNLATTGTSKQTAFGVIIPPGISGNYGTGARWGLGLSAVNTAGLLFPSNAKFLYVTVSGSAKLAAGAKIELWGVKK